MKVALRILISGEVQGVGLRYTSQKTAQALGLKGYIRNLKDGRVELVAEGEQAEIEKLTDWLSSGAPGRIDQVNEEEMAFSGHYQDFKIIY